MAETRNLNLYVTDDSSETFQNFRRQLAGEIGSNMTKLDDRFASGSVGSSTVYATLLASAWVGTAAPYTQEIAVAGLRADHNGSIGLPPNATYDQRQAVRDAKLCTAGQSAGKLVIAADGERPTVDIPAAIVLIG